MTSLSHWQIHNEFIIFFANSLWINYLFFCKFTMNSLSFLWYHYDLTFGFANSLSFRKLWWLRLSREVTIKSLSVSRNEYWSIFVTKIHYGLTVFSNDEIVGQPLSTFYGLIIPRIILNFNCRQNSESKHMYLWYISTNRPDLTPIGRNRPQFDLWWPQSTLENIQFEFLR